MLRFVPLINPKTQTINPKPYTLVLWVRGLWFTAKAEGLGFGVDLCGLRFRVDLRLLVGKGSLRFKVYALVCKVDGPGCSVAI